MIKLIGSMQEQAFRKELIGLNECLFEDKTYPGLLSFLRAQFPAMKNAIVVDWVPGPDYETYTILINDDVIGHVEIDRSNRGAQPTVETDSLANYRQGLSKNKQIKLLVALELAPA